MNRARKIMVGLTLSGTLAGCVSPVKVEKDYESSSDRDSLMINQDDIAIYGKMVRNYFEARNENMNAVQKDFFDDFDITKASQIEKELIRDLYFLYDENHPKKSIMEGLTLAEMFELLDNTRKIAMYETLMELENQR